MKTLTFLYENQEKLQEYCNTHDFKNLQTKAKAVLVQIFSGIVDDNRCLLAAKLLKK